MKGNESNASKPWLNIRNTKQDNIDITLGLRFVNKNRLTDDELIELKELITERTNQRLKFIKEGKNIWDYSILLLQIVSGMVD